MIAIASPIIEDEEIQAVNEVLKSGIVAQGPRVAALEDAFAQYCGTKYAVAVNSGTAALHAALFAADVGPGDEVITVPFSFIATVNTVIMLGAKPVLVDIDLDTYNMDTTQLEAAITDKTKAIMPVHLYGQPANMDEIQAIAKKHKLRIIEDAAQAIGAEYKGTKAGALGDMGCFSLYATKNIMCGEGGMVTTDSEDMMKLLKQFRQHGMGEQYQYNGLGYNYRMTDLQAAIALEQLKKADMFNTARQDNAAYMYEKLQALSGLTLPIEVDDRTHVYHQFTVRLSESIERAAIVTALRERGIIAGVYYPQPLHHIAHIAAYGYKKTDFPSTVTAAATVLSLPIHPRVTKKDIDTIVKELTACL